MEGASSRPAISKDSRSAADGAGRTAGVVRRAVHEPNLDRLRYDLWDTLGVWAGLRLVAPDSRQPAARGCADGESRLAIQREGTTASE